MKNSHLLAGAAALAAFFLAGCGHLDLAAPGDPNRVVVGSVSFANPSVLPADAQILVRVMNPHPQPPGTGTTSLTPPGQMPLLNQPIYRKLFGDLEPQYPVARVLNRAGFYIGCHPGMTFADVDYVVEQFRAYFRQS